MDEQTANHAGALERGVTLTQLRDRQHSLNMRILLALQTHDDALRASLEAELQELQEQIDRLHMPDFYRNT